MKPLVALNLDLYLHQGGGRYGLRLGFRDTLGSAPEVHVGDLMDTGNGAVRGAALFGQERPPDVAYVVVLQGDAGEAALL